MEWIGAMEWFVGVTFKVLLRAKEDLSGAALVRLDICISEPYLLTYAISIKVLCTGRLFIFPDQLYEGQSKITEPYLIAFELSKMEIYLDDISLKLYVIYLIT